MMPPDEVEADAALVRRLLAGQFPHWAELPIARGAPGSCGVLGSCSVSVNDAGLAADGLPSNGWAFFFEGGSTAIGGATSVNVGKRHVAEIPPVTDTS